MLLANFGALPLQSVQSAGELKNGDHLSSVLSIKGRLAKPFLDCTALHLTSVLLESNAFLHRTRSKMAEEDAQSDTFIGMT